MYERPLALLAAALLPWLSACSGPAPPPPPAETPISSAARNQSQPVYAPALIAGVPHVQQKPDFCGEAAVEMYTTSLGHRFDQDQVFEMSGMDPSRGMGVTTRELKTALERIGFQVGPVWHQVRAAEAERELDAQFAALHADLVRGVPSVVCMHYDARPQTTEHFRLVLGYDPEKDEIVYHEPAVAQGSYLRMARRAFLALWPLKYDPNAWTVIRFPLEHGELASPPEPRVHGPGELAQHVMQLRAKLPASFTVVVEPPFVVIGDGDRDAVARSAERTVRWAVTRLKKDFFPRDPREILDIYLFKDAQSYEHYCDEWFGGPPSTPYGFYSSEKKALVMNIATGGGTLVHEIVHPFVEANVPDCPAWFNEGLGSLYEQSSARGEHIVGLTNWRLAGLQQALREGRVPSFARLTSTTDRQFYDADEGTNYAQARYLLYYLQERGLLVDYYRAFVAVRDTDPTGYETLKAILGRPDMDAFERDWARYVLGLTFP